jgi:hypothetical protein
VLCEFIKAIIIMLRTTMKTRDRSNNNNKMKKRIRLLLVSSLSLLYFSCYYDQEIVLPEVPDIPDDVTISFTADIEPLFSQSGKDCTACHNGNIATPVLRAGNAYNQIIPLVIPGDALGSEFYQKLPGNGHPFDVGFVLDADEIVLIKGWIDRGAENN